MRVKIYFYCSNCNRQNYFSTKNKIKAKTKISMKKFCKQCQKTVVHNEKTK